MKSAADYRTAIGKSVQIGHNLIGFFGHGLVQVLAGLRNGYSFRYGKADSIILTGIRIRVLSEYDDFHFFERARVEDMENLKRAGQKMYLFIDEYDHFTNAILSDAESLHRYTDETHGEGYLRAFFNKVYFLQSYQESGQVLSPDSCKSFSREEMEEFARIVSPYAGIVRLRGID